MVTSGQETVTSQRFLLDLGKEWGIVRTKDYLHHISISINQNIEFFILILNFR